MPPTSRNTSLWLCILVILVPSWALQFGLKYAAHHHVAPLEVIVALIMWVPALVGLVYLRLEGRSWKVVGWKLPSWRYALAALAVPIGAIVAVALMEIQLGCAVAVRPLELRGLLLPGLATFLGLMAMAMVTSLGEELGWRGYLQKRFLDRFGLLGGLLLLGLVWGYWHAPVFYLFRVYKAYPVFGALVLNPIDLVLGAFFTAWLYLRTGSIWAPTLAHAAYDVMDNLCFGQWIVQDDALKRWALSAALQGLVAVYCYYALKQDRLEAGKAEGAL